MRSLSLPCWICEWPNVAMTSFFIITTLHAGVILRRQGDGVVKVGEELADTGGLALFGLLQFEFQFTVIAVAIAEDRVILLRFVIGGDDPFVVAQHHLVGGDREEIIGSQRD